MNDYHGKTLLILGMGLSGRSAAEFLLSQGADVFAYDENSHFLASDSGIQTLKSLGLKIFDFTRLEQLETFDAALVSPGLSPNSSLYQKVLDAGIEIIGEAELACRHITSPCIGVTGTNGKTTVTLLIAHILNHHGIMAEAVGNIGVPLTSLITRPQKSPGPLLVMELSSYQLETMKSKVLDAAILLNVTPDHLERHLHMEGYAAAKAQIFDCLKPSGKGYVSGDCQSAWSCLRAKTSLSTYDDNERFLEKLRQRRPQIKSHDAANCMAAYAVCLQWGISQEQFISAFESFIKPPHRMEWVRNIEGVDYIDDSKGTNIDAVLKAVDSLEGLIILIAGGVDKGSSYEVWTEPFRDKVRFICTIGTAAAKMHKELSAKFLMKNFETLEDAVFFSNKLAKNGDTVLLSPGCASYDMFTDYAHRGREFKRVVNLI